jgi:hypothetical protein
MASTRWQCTGLLGLLCAACAYTDAGEGSQTLAVQVALSYTPTLADTTLLQSAIFNVRELPEALHQASRPPIPPSIALRFTDTDTQQKFSFTQNVHEDMQELPGYHRHLQIHLGAEQADNLNCHLEAPGPHTLKVPRQAARWSKTRPMTVVWQTNDGIPADVVDIQLNLAKQQFSVQKDTGSFTIAAAHWVEGNETLTVTRRNRVVPRGATAQSYIQVQYEVIVHFQVLP